MKKIFITSADPKIKFETKQIKNETFFNFHGESKSK